ncbi:hypothetical protein [Ornithinimicrobium sp. INDO-MA30-4]|nr:hypothetical protein [Ornithinimicrobium sp. INDO-MA30-4]UJH69471.1 hypothetical protein L0A91_08680 [Ornithinimicrobium sp. INDO-MA30-4]
MSGTDVLGSGTTGVGELGNGVFSEIVLANGDDAIEHESAASGRSH